MKKQDKEQTNKTIIASGDNCKVVLIDDTKLVVVVDLTKNCGRSSTDKSITVGTTRGNKKFKLRGKEFRVGCNVFISDDKKKKKKNKKKNKNKVKIVKTIF